jgi:RNA methyltransferase, TrmH family
MLSQNQGKFIASLGIKKYRQKYRKFIVEGEKMVGELLSGRAFVVDHLFGTQRWAENNAAMLQPFLDNFNLVTDAELAKISTLSTPNAVLAIVEMPAIDSIPVPSNDELCLYLDGLQDPGNLGTILRIADWFGVGTVFCSPDCVDVYSPKVVQATMGAIFRIKTQEIDIEQLLQERPEWPVLGAILDGDDVFSIVPPTRGLLVIGNEGRGIRPETAARLTQRVSISRHPAGRAESLNAAVATGILLAVLRRNG